MDIATRNVMIFLIIVLLIFAVQLFLKSGEEVDLGKYFKQPEEPYDPGYEFEDRLSDDERMRLRKEEKELESLHKEIMYDMDRSDFYHD